MTKNNEVMKHRRLVFLLTALLSLTGFKAFAHDIEVANSDGVTIYYTYQNNNTELAVSYRGRTYSSYPNEYTGNVAIPQSVTYNGKVFPVTSIGDYAFGGCSRLTSVTLPNSVSIIGNGAFLGCSGLTSVTIPSNITSAVKQRLSFKAENYCASQWDASTNTFTWGLGGWNSTFVFITAEGICGDLSGWKLLHLHTSDFMNASAQQLTVAFRMNDGSVPPIGPTKEFFVSPDTSGNIDISLKGIDWSTALGEICDNTNIQGIFIYGCDRDDQSKNASVKITDTYYIEERLASVTIGNSVTSIGSYAFSGCSGLTSVIIPLSVTSIGVGVFSDCSSLTSIQVDADNIKYDSRNNCNAIIEIATNTLVAGCKNTTIPSSVTNIGELAFSGCSNLASITIPSGITSIGNDAFSGCSGLTSVTVPSSVTNIGNGAFGYSGLTSIKVDPGNKKYDSRDNCNAIIETATITLIAGCKNTVIPSNVTSIDNYAFSGCSGLTSVTIPSSVTSIGESAFSGCSGLTSVTIPLGVTSIGESAFSGCSGLTSVTIPSGVTSIDNFAFSGCSALNSVIIPSGVTSIGKMAFYNCLGLTSITIPSSVTIIGSMAFSDCSGLTSITFSSSMLRVGNTPFYHCSSLTDVYCYVDEVLDIELPDVFSRSNYTNATLHVPAASVAAYQTTEPWSGFKEVVAIDELQRYLASLTDTEDSFVDGVYRREFKNGDWQALYVPFEMDYNDWSGAFDVANINGLRKLDGHIVIEATIIENGTLQANYPYLIRAKSDYGAMLTVNVTGSVTKTTNSVTFYGLNYSEGMTLPIIGNYSKRTGLKSSYERRMQGGTLSIPGSDSEVLMPYRWYVVPGQMTSRELRLRVNGEKVMAIDNASVSKEDEEPLVYDLQGRKVDDGQQLKGGLYIINNKKYVVK